MRQEYPRSLHEFRKLFSFGTSYRRPQRSPYQERGASTSESDGRLQILLGLGSQQQQITYKQLYLVGLNG